MRFLCLLLVFLFPLLSYAGEILWIPIEGEIEWGKASFLKRALAKASQDKVDAVVLEISTFGGRLDSMIEMRDSLLSFPIPTFSFINPRAISAGSLLALATDHIYITPGGTIGAATPVTGGLGKMKEASEKVVSYTRALFRTTASAKKHSPLLAEAFVDKDVELVEVEGGKLMYKQEAKGKKVLRVISPRGKLLTLSGKEARQVGLAEGNPSSREEFLKLSGLRDEKIEKVFPNPGEKLAGILTNSTVSSLLFSLGILALIFEFTMPGWGISGTAGVILLLLFFTGKYFAGLLEWLDILLFLLGCTLLLVEVFLIPGFGIAGIAGILLILTSLYLSLVKYPLPHTPIEWKTFREAIYSISFSFAVLLAGFLAFLKFLPRTPLFSHLALSTSLKKKEFTALPDYSFWIGKRGKTISHIRPAGKVEIEGKIIDVVSEGEFIEPGEMVKVVKTEGPRIVVKKIVV